jgi:two-component system, OmpR family, sensor histidine kinase KdpD
MKAYSIQAVPAWPAASVDRAEQPPTVVAARRWLIQFRSAAPALLPFALALAGVAVSTWLSFRFGQSFAFTGFLHLVLVVLAAMYGGIWQATAISVIAAGCLNYYFVPPIYSFVNSPANWVALGAFEFTALVISRLSLRAKQQALEAIGERRDMERLYETSRRILLFGNSGEPGSLIASLIRQTFDLRGVDLFDAVSGAMYQSGQCAPEADRRTRDAYYLGADTFDPETKTWYCAIRRGTRPVGGLALRDTTMSKLAATALASLCGIALERARSLQRESHAEAARQTEQLRTAVLDALAHQFKTPLTVARTASSGLLAIGGLSELQAELVTIIDRQANTLDRLAGRLLRTATLDRAEFQPRCEPLLISGLASAATGRIDLDAERSRFQVSVAGRERPVLADRELMLNALAQLVDNAIRYSEPRSPIEIRVTAGEGQVVFTIRTKGLVVADGNAERIFDRFYRAPETQHLPAGTGLGLSIVKRIVAAHRGSVWATGEPGFGTSFSISLPAAVGQLRDQE